MEVPDPYRGKNIRCSTCQAEFPAFRPDERPFPFDCPECENEGCVDKNGHCHYCNPEDDEMESGREYGEDELPPPPPITRPTVY